MIKCSQEADWLDLVESPYYANANQLKQVKSILVVPTQLDRAKTPLPESLYHSTYPFTIISFIIVIIIVNNFIINIIFFIFNIA